jgi:hypothetical protein
MADDDGWSNGNSFNLEAHPGATRSNCMEPFYPWGCTRQNQDRGSM